MTALMEIVDFRDNHVHAFSDGMNFIDELTLKHDWIL